VCVNRAFKNGVNKTLKGPLKIVILKNFIFGIQPMPRRSFGIRILLTNFLRESFRCGLTSSCNLVLRLTVRILLPSQLLLLIYPRARLTSQVYLRFEPVDTNKTFYCCNSPFCCNDRCNGYGTSGANVRYILESYFRALLLSWTAEFLQKY
jgi:hypothetical protein